MRHFNILHLSFSWLAFDTTIFFWLNLPFNVVNFLRRIVLCCLYLGHVNAIHNLVNQIAPFLREERP